MQKIVYCAAIMLLFIVVMAGMWFFPVGRDLEADNDYLQQSPMSGSVPKH